jgi:beta-glucosidase-like glycosyl hydrolase/CubicO group peptidase (beta-lactamase class C family)
MIDVKSMKSLFPFLLFLLANLSYAQRELPSFLRESDVWAQEQLKKMSLEEQVAQSFMVATLPFKGEDHVAEIDSIIDHFKIGGLITFQGEKNQTKLNIKHFQDKSQIPLLIGLDAEWGASMRIADGQKFPYQLTMGAANDEKNTRVIAEAMADELIDLGVNLSFSPVMDVNTNPANPIIGFRSFGASPLIAGKLGGEMIKGLESKNVLSCMKHFPGHGDTDMDSHLSLPTINKSLRELDIVDWTPFKMGRLAGASAVMMAHLNVPALDSSGTPSSLSSIIIKDYLRKRLKFSGLVISDALNMKGVTSIYGDVEVAVKAYLAGNDILLFPSKIKSSMNAILDAIDRGDISKEEVEEKCLRILRAKYFSIIKEKDISSVNPNDLHYAKTAIAEKSLTVIKNDSVFPVNNVQGKFLVLNVGVEGRAFEERLPYYLQNKVDVIHAYSGTEVVQRRMDTLNHYDYVFINIYATGMWPYSNYSYPKGWKQMLAKLPAQTNSIVTLFGNPYAAKELETSQTKAIILAYENSDYAAERAVQLIFGSFKSTSKLPVTISSKLQEGFGIETPDASRLKFSVPEEVGASREKLRLIDSIALDGIANGAYPGCQIVAAKDGVIFYRKSFGYYTYDSLKRVHDSTIYDLASITKIASSTMALMRLQDQNRLNLNGRLKDYMPEVYSVSQHGNIIIREMMAHQAGLTPWIPFYTKTLKDGKPSPELYSSMKNDSMSKTVSDNLYILSSYEDTIMTRILNSRLRSKRYKYSDVGYYHLKMLIENETKMKLNQFVHSTFYEPMGLVSMRYKPLDFYSKDNIAPTEIDGYFRHHLVHGHVHDMGAAMTDGVGGHAGVFSTATDLASLMQMLLNEGVYGGKRYLSKEVVKEFTKCQYCPSNRRGAGFDKPVRSLDGGPTCDLVSLSSFGHSGFTGTQTWADPEYGINYVFLSNRVYPSAENWKLVKMSIRTEIQRLIYESVGVQK